MGRINETELVIADRQIRRSQEEVDRLHSALEALSRFEYYGQNIAGGIAWYGPGPYDRPWLYAQSFLTKPGDGTEEPF